MYKDRSSETREVVFIGRWSYTGHLIEVAMGNRQSGLSRQVVSKSLFDCICIFAFCRENLYNTNEKFDYGGFRELAEQQSQVQTTTTLFAYQFVDPGVYVFTLSNNTAKKMVR